MSNGPTLAIVGDCAGCDHHFTTDYTPTMRYVMERRERAAAP